MSDINILAHTNFRKQEVKFGIKSKDRQRHVYVIGKTGTGKTTLLENMAIQDIQNGRGVGIVDPHGEFAQKMLDHVPSDRINDVIYFNPADLEYPIAFNFIEKVDSEYRHLVASGLVGIFKKLWAESWGPRLEYVLRNAILALLEYPESTLLGIMRMLTDKIYRNKVINNLKDPVVKAFWVDEFAKYPDRFMAEAVAPIQNKVGQFLTSSLIRNIVGQTTSTIDIRKAMDEKKILIMNLSKGAIGEDNSALLGAMLITRIQLAAMSRIDIAEEERQNFYLYVDEFQNFATESFADILSEARKYRLNLTLAHQYIAQMDEVVRDAALGNVGTTIAFRVGAYDAEYLEKEFAPEFTAQDIVNLGFADTYLRLMIDGMASRPFSAHTLPPIPKPEESYREKIIKVSRERYTSSREEVESKIAKWSGVIKAEEEERMIKEEELFDSKCFNCGKEIKVKFKPDGVRPVYCPDCLEKVRKEKNEKDNKTIKSDNKTIKPDDKTIKPKEEDVSLSLKEATAQEAQTFRPQKKRKEVDFGGLRDALKDAIGSQEDNKEKTKKTK